MFFSYVHPMYWNWDSESVDFRSSAYFVLFFFSFFVFPCIDFDYFSLKIFDIFHYLLEFNRPCPDIARITATLAPANWNLWNTPQLSKVSVNPRSARQASRLSMSPWHIFLEWLHLDFTCLITLSSVWIF